MTDEEKRDKARKMIWQMDVEKLEYTDWINVGFIMQNLGFEVSEWREWSRRDNRFSEEECKNRWLNFKRDGNRYGFSALTKMYETYCSQKEDSKIKNIDHERFGRVRVVDIDGEFWFVVADICKALSISRAQMRRLNDNDRRLYPMPALIEAQKMIITNMAGLYSLMPFSKNLEAKSWLENEVIVNGKINFITTKSSSENYDSNSLSARKGRLGEEIVKKNIEHLVKNCRVERPAETFKSGASIVDYVVICEGERDSYFVEVKTQAVLPFGVEKAPCYSFPKSRIEAYKEYGKSHGKKIKMYIVDPCSGFVYFEDLNVLEMQCNIDARRYPFDKWNEKFGGEFHYWHRAQFGSNFAIESEDIAALEKLFESRCD